MNKRLYRSETNRLVAGVCGGLGQSFAIDPVLIRLAFALLMIFEFWLGLITYILAAILIPIKGSNNDVLEAEVVDHPYSQEESGSPRKLAVALICVGGGLLLFRFAPSIPGLSRYIKILKLSYWPLALIALGIWLIFRADK